MFLFSCFLLLSSVFWVGMMPYWVVVVVVVVRLLLRLLFLLPVVVVMADLKMLE